ncbi:MAG: hypothetical protein WAK26_14365 [Terracidiphilus sp.]
MTIDHLERAAAEQDREDKEARELKIKERAFINATREQTIADSQAMADSIARVKEQHKAEHEVTRAAARAAKDTLRELTAESERCQSRVGFSRADLEGAQKNRDRCLKPKEDDYPTDGELDAWRQRYGQLENECYSIAARIAREQTELDAALHRQWEQERIFADAAAKEREARNAL